jgi:hypothetical protein
VKRSFSILASVIATTGIAHAGGTVKLSPLDTAATTAPRVVNSSLQCDKPDARVRATRLTFDDHEVNVLRECSKDIKTPRTQLVFESKDGKYQSYWSGTGQWSEQLVIGKLKDGRHALLHRIDTDAAGETDVKGRVDVCAYDKAGALGCGFVEFDCPETGCKEPEILKGALWVHAKGGRKRFPITE